MIFLGAFTLAEAFLVGMITSFFDIEVVAIAFLTTCVAVAVLAIIACQVSCRTRFACMCQFYMTLFDTPDKRSRSRIGAWSLTWGLGGIQWAVSCALANRMV